MGINEGINEWDIVRCLKQAFLHFSSSHLLIFDGMVDIVGITGRVIGIKIDPGRLFAKPDHGIIQ